MSFTRAKPSGWIDGERLFAAQLNQIDTNASRGLDGTNGGTYTLLSPMVLQGAALTLSGAVTASSFTMSGTNRVSLASRSITRVLDSSTPFFPDGDFASLGGLSYKHNVAVGAAFEYPVHVPHGATITGIKVWMTGPTHGGAWPPATPANIALLCNTYGPFASTSIGTASASTAVQATYEAGEYISITGLSRVVDRATEVYSLSVTTEHGANGIVGAAFGQPIVTYTITSMDED